MKVRVPTIIAIVAAAAFLLSGCTPADDPDHDVAAPLAFTVVAGAPIVRTCVPMTITEMDIVSYKSESDDNGTQVWEADGQARVPADHEFVLGTAIHGMKVDQNDHKQYASAEFAFEMNVVDAQGHDRFTFSDFFPGDLAEGKWANGNGNRTSVPCKASTCKSTPTSCDERWNSTAAARRLTPQTTPNEIPASAPRLTSSVSHEAISFTRVDGVAYAQLCAARTIDTETLSEALIDSDPSKGWVDVVISSTTVPRSFPTGTRWRVGTALPGENVTAGQGMHLDLSTGTYKVELDNLIGSGSSVSGHFRASDLTDGQWLNSAGKPESAACATYKASQSHG